jgi:uncharacterized protein YndB with AHSA1/START domain
MTISKSGARAVAAVGEGTIVGIVEIAAPVERVFRALTDGDEITKWWGSPELYRTTGWVADLRPGGHWRASGVGADGASFHVEGDYREVDPPHRLVHTWKAPWDGDNETTVSYKLEAIEGGTRVTLRHEGFAGRVDSCRGHAAGWERVLDWLVDHVAPVEAQRYYFCRLIPPRPTFATDLDAAEAAMMREHAQYWRGLLAEGNAVVFGPVADPAGAWGLGVLRASNDEALEALRQGDPAIKSGRGFRYEVLPMIRAVVR